ncbi:hypothetical protein BGAL_0046g00470 [Botrytis galanthina]|uniref:Uncharacterized protein n=1 Tax=Botrytis galanthina TaxID=278940 RepID=A0A4S8R8R9_9HELO|nr:hypothetical protein BGAL_0046g00470 [Botrytis galanthina]
MTTFARLAEDCRQYRETHLEDLIQNITRGLQPHFDKQKEYFDKVSSKNNEAIEALRLSIKTQSTELANLKEDFQRGWNQTQTTLNETNDSIKIQYNSYIKSQNQHVSRIREMTKINAGLISAVSILDESVQDIAVTLESGLGSLERIRKTLGKQSRSILAHAIVADRQASAMRSQTKTLQSHAATIQEVVTSSEATTTAIYVTHSTLKSLCSSIESQNTSIKNITTLSQAASTAIQANDSSLKILHSSLESQKDSIQAQNDHLKYYNEILDKSNSTLSTHTRFFNRMANCLNTHTETAKTSATTLSNHTSSLNNIAGILKEHTQSINTSTTTLSNHKSSLNNIAGILKEHTQSIETSTATLSNHASSLNNMVETLSGHTKSIEISTTTLNTHTTTLGNTRDVLNLHTSSLNKITKSFNEYTESTKTSAAILSNHTISPNKMEETLNGHTKSIEISTTSLNTHTTTLRKTGDALNLHTDAVHKQSQEINGYITAANGHTAIIRQSATSINQIFQHITSVQTSICTQLSWFQVSIMEDLDQTTVTLSNLVDKSEARLMFLLGHVDTSISQQIRKASESFGHVASSLKTSTANLSSRVEQNVCALIRNEMITLSAIVSKEVNDAIDTILINMVNQGNGLSSSFNEILGLKAVIEKVPITVDQNLRSKLNQLKYVLFTRMVKMGKTYQDGLGETMHFLQLGFNLIHDTLQDSQNTIAKNTEAITSLSKNIGNKIDGLPTIQDITHHATETQKTFKLAIPKIRSDLIDAEPTLVRRDNIVRAIEATRDANYEVILETRDEIIRVMKAGMFLHSSQVKSWLQSIWDGLDATINDLEFGEAGTRTIYDTIKKHSIFDDVKLSSSSSSANPETESVHGTDTNNVTSQQPRKSPSLPPIPIAQTHPLNLYPQQPPPHNGVVSISIDMPTEPNKSIQEVNNPMNNNFEEADSDLSVPNNQSYSSKGKGREKQD